MSEPLHAEHELSPEQVLATGNVLLQHFGIDADPAGQPDQFLETLKQLNPRYKEDRTLVRYELEADETQWDDTTKEVIMRTAENMGLLDAETPLAGDYDVVIVLGGARQSNLDRARYAATAAQEGGATFGSMVVAGSGRILKEAEQASVANYAPGAQTEYDLCAAAAATVAQESPGLPVDSKLVEGDKVDTAAIVTGVLSSLQASGNLPENARVAAVTTQIYRTFTQLDLARAAKPFGVNKTFTAGNPSDPAIAAKRTPATYLSEILRTLKAATNALHAE